MCSHVRCNSYCGIEYYTVIYCLHIYFFCHSFQTVITLLMLRPTERRAFTLERHTAYETQFTPATMSKQRSILLPKTATMSNEFCVEISSFRQSRILLRQSRTLLRHCCWFGPGSTPSFWTVSMDEQTLSTVKRSFFSFDTQQVIQAIV